MLDYSYQGVKRLFVFAYNNVENNANKVDINFFKNYLLPRVNIEITKTEICGRNFYDQSINDLIKQYDEVKKYQQDKMMII